ncbi:MAG: EamA family transporter [Clostridia bacterium]|nr:EamA family transporter [Clostridia bacterium]
MFQYYALFLAACLGGSLNSVWLYKKYQQSAGTELSSDVVYLVINGVVSALVSAGVIVFTGRKLEFTWFSLAIAAAIVISSAVNVIGTLKAYEKGQIATVNIVNTVGTIILSCLWGVTVLGETLTASRTVAIALMLAATFLITFTGDKKSSKGMILIYVLVVIGGSLVSILNKQHQVETNFATVDTLSFSFLAASVRTVIFGIAAVVMRLKKGKGALKIPGRSALFASASSFVSGSCYILTLFTAIYLPIVVTSPLSTGLSIIVSALFPWIFYREKLNVRQIAGVALSIAGALWFLLF